MNAPQAGRPRGRSRAGNPPSEDKTSEHLCGSKVIPLQNKRDPWAERLSKHRIRGWRAASANNTQLMPDNYSESITAD